MFDVAHHLPVDFEIPLEHLDNQEGGAENYTIVLIISFGSKHKVLRLLLTYVFKICILCFICLNFCEFIVC